MKNIKQAVTIDTVKRKRENYSLLKNKKIK